MADKYSVIYDPVNREPFAIIRNSSVATTAHPIQKTAEGWATQYNGGAKDLPHGMTSTDFVEMNCDFVQSFKSAFSREDRLQRRVEMMAEPKQKFNSNEIVYGVGPTQAKRRPLDMSRKVMPVITHLQQEVFRSRFIHEAIRTGKRWLRKRTV